jgi:hypothetical protein
MFISPEMPLTHQDNEVSMGGTLKDVSTQKKLLHFGGLKRPAKLTRRGNQIGAISNPSTGHKK